MSDIKKIEGDCVVRGARFAIVAGRFNSFIVDHLVSGAVDALLRHGAVAQDISITYAPGAYELPLVAQRLAASKRYDAIIAVGAVIRGSTPHFDYVAGECSKGLAHVALHHDLPVAFGVLTVDTIEQAIERAGTKAGNKGVDAVLSAIEMVNLLQQISKP